MSDPTIPGGSDPAPASGMTPDAQERPVAARPVLLLGPDLRVDAGGRTQAVPLRLEPGDRARNGPAAGSVAAAPAMTGAAQDGGGPEDAGAASRATPPDPERAADDAFHDDLSHDGAARGEAAQSVSPSDGLEDAPSGGPQGRNTGADMADQIRQAVRDPETARDRADAGSPEALERQVAALKAAVSASHAAQADGPDETLRPNSGGVSAPGSTQETGGPRTAGTANDADQPTETPRFIHRRGGEAQMEPRQAARNAVLDPSSLTEDMLRDLIADVVRKELSGATGQKVTGNIRKLVRREVARHLSTRDDE